LAEPPVRFLGKVIEVVPVIMSTRCVDKAGPTLIFCKDRTNIIPGARILQAILREDTANRIGTNETVNVIRANDLVDGTILQLQPHIRVVLGMNQGLREMIKESATSLGLAVPRDLATLLIGREQMPVETYSLNS
jgi:hypothetical protein